MTRPTPWRFYDPITTAKMNALVKESLRSRNTAVSGPGKSIVSDEIGAISAHQQRGGVLFAVAVEDFASGSYTDNYNAIDSTPSGLCRLVRYNKETGGYAEESGFDSFRIWDPEAEMNDSPSKKEGDVFHAAYNTDNQRIEVIASSANLEVRHGLTIECIGQGFWLIELMDCLQVNPPVCSLDGGWPTTSSSNSASASEDPCDLCATDPECGGMNFNTADNCTVGAVDPARPRKDSECYPLVGTGEYVVAYDKRAVPLKPNGMVTVLWNGDYCKRPSEDQDEPALRVESCSASDSASVYGSRIKIYTVLTGEYELVRIPHEEWECCLDGTVKKVRCTTFIVEGTYCESPYDPCDGSTSGSPSV